MRRSRVRASWASGRVVSSSTEVRLIRVAKADVRLIRALKEAEAEAKAIRVVKVAKVEAGWASEASIPRTIVWIEMRGLPPDCPSVVPPSSFATLHVP